MSTNKERTASDWYSLLHGSDVDENIRQEFQQWRQSCEQNNRSYEACEMAMLLMGTLKNTPEITPYLIEAKNSVVETRYKKDHKSNHPWWNIGLDDTLYFPRLLNTPIRFTQLFYALCIFVSLFLFSFKSENSPASNYNTPIGKQQQITLKDGSEVNLNTNSQLHVYYQEDRRHLILNKGEATFSVAHAPDRPFDVVAGDGIVRALGTRFNVLIEEDTVKVSVLEGKVTVLRNDPNLNNEVPIILTAGLSANYKPNRKLHISTNDNEIARIDAWLNGKLIFSNWRLEDAIIEHNRYALKKITLADESLEDMEFSGVFRVGDTQGFAKALQGLLPIKVIEHESYFLIRKHVHTPSTDEKPK